MVDYVLTVAVSISAGVAAIISIPEFSSLADHRVELGVGLILLITLLEHARHQGVGADLRHSDVPVHARLRRADRLRPVPFASPATSARFPTTPSSPRRHASSAARSTLFLLLKGFSSGAVALTGIEAISNGVPAFRRPESKNAAATLVWMGVLLGTMFLGISILAHRLQPYPSHDRTVIAQLGLQVFGNGALFVFLQFATAAILVLAANTAYNGFPSLSSIIAYDGYLPRQLMNRGDRLVFSNGIILLAGAAALLLVAFGGITNALIPLYAVGVFTSFTLSQIRHGPPPPEAATSPTGGAAPCSTRVGAIATLIVLLIVAITKFTSGAWVPIVIIPAIVLLFKAIKRHYTNTADRLRVPPDFKPPRRRHTVVVLVEDINAGALEALAYGTSIAPDHLLAVTVVADGPDAEQFEKKWSEHGITVPLEIVQTQTGEFTAATLAYIDEVAAPLGERHRQRAHPRVLRASTGGVICCTTRAR